MFATRPVRSPGRYIPRLAAVFGAVLTLSSTISPAASTAALGQTAISDGAYAVLNSRTEANRNHFFVYRNQDDGFNHGFPSGIFGNIGTVHLDTGCMFDSSAAQACSSDPNLPDRTRGTVLRITFDAQSPGTFAGVNLEEPENWGVLRSGSGYDVRGATSVSLDVYSPDGAMVQFGIGGCTAPFTAPLAASWTTVTIALNALDCTPDLSNVHILFGIATNDFHAPHGATVLLDNIQFSPTPTAQQSALSFPLSTETFGVLPRQTAPIPFDQSLRNLTTIYESALSEVSLLARGTPRDLADARLIADTFDYALHHDSHGDPIPVASDGSVGLHNADEGGDVALFNSQAPPKQGRAGDVRLAGFTATTLCPTSGFCLMLDGATGGNNAFAMIALLAAYREFSDPRYLTDAEEIGTWVVKNLKDASGTGYGGYFLGYDDGGVPPPKPLVHGKSVENNADLFAAFTGIAGAEAGLGHAGPAATWTDAANVAGDFVMLMFDPAHGRFNVGTVLAGSPPAPGNCPTGPQRGSEVINVCDFLDSDTFTTLALAGSPRYFPQIDWRLPVQYAWDTFKQTVTAGGRTYQGFNLVATPVSGPNGIAWEFTAQAVETMHYVDQLYDDSRFEAPASLYLSQIAQAQLSSPFADGAGLVASTVEGGDTLPPSLQCVNTPFQCIPERVGLAATTWAILADLNVNVLTGPTLSVTPMSADPGANVTVSWSNVTVSSSNVVAPTTARDWIGLYDSDTADPHAFRGWQYTSCTRMPSTAQSSGSCPFSMPTAPGTYHFRLFSNNGYTEIARSAHVIVVGATLAASPTIVPPGGATTLTWSHILAPTPADWLGVYAPGAPDRPPLDWEYVSCSKARTVSSAAGSCPFVFLPTLAPGTYEFRLFSNNGFTRLAVSNAVTIVLPHPTITLQPARVSPGGAFNVQWSGWSPTSTRDWIALSALGAPDKTYLDWDYVSCSRVPSATLPSGSGACPFNAPLHIGNYEMRLFTNNTFIKVASASLTVAGPASLSAAPTSVPAGGSVTGGWSTVPTPTPKEWIGLYLAGADDSAFIDWVYDSSCTKSAGAVAAASGSCDLHIPTTAATGTYELRLFRNNGFTVLAASNPFSVTGGAGATGVQPLPAPAVKPQAGP